MEFPNYDWNEPSIAYRFWLHATVPTRSHGIRLLIVPKAAIVRKSPSCRPLQHGLDPAE